MSDTPPRFVAVGHCGPDAAMIRSAIRRVHPEAVIEAVDDDARLAAFRTPGTIWLINRALDGHFVARDGNELLAREATAAHGATLVLISNFEDAQDAAVAAGGVRGFGKRALHAPETAALLRSLTAP